METRDKVLQLFERSMREKNSRVMLELESSDDVLSLEDWCKELKRREGSVPEWWIDAGLGTAFYHDRLRMFVRECIRKIQELNEPCYCGIATYYKWS